MTFQDFHEKRQEEFYDNCKGNRDDGLILLVLKKTMINCCFRWQRSVFTKSMLALEYLSGHLIKSLVNGDELGNDKDEKYCEVQYGIAINLYMVIWTLILFVFYWISFLFAKSNGIDHSVVVRLVCLLFSTFSMLRLIEIVMFIAVIHSNENYTPNSLSRSVVNTIWHYGEIVIIFATFYLTAYSWNDKFSSSGGDEFVKSFVNSLYFSFVTVSTLGYGDFAPQHTVGKMMVISEVLVGLFLLVIVLQRAIGNSQSDT